MKRNCSCSTSEGEVCEKCYLPEIDPSISRLRVLSAILREQDTITKFGCFVQEATDIDLLIEKLEYFEKNALRFMKLSDDGAMDTHAKVVRFQEVQRFDPPCPTPVRGGNDSFASEARVVYERQAIREIRIEWVDTDGSQPTLLHMLDASLEEGGWK